MTISTLQRHLSACSVQIIASETDHEQTLSALFTNSGGVWFPRRRSTLATAQEQFLGSIREGSTSIHRFRIIKPEAWYYLVHLEISMETRSTHYHLVSLY